MSRRTSPRPPRGSRGAARGRRRRRRRSPHRADRRCRPPPPARRAASPRQSSAAAASSGRTMAGLSARKAGRAEGPRRERRQARQHRSGPAPPDPPAPAAAARTSACDRACEPGVLIRGGPMPGSPYLRCRGENIANTRRRKQAGVLRPPTGKMRSFVHTGFRRMAAALTYRDFRVLWFGAFASTIGTWMQKVAQSWLVLTLAGPSSAFFLGLDAFLGELPILLFTLIGGVFADRRDRRQLLLASQYVQMAAAFALAALVYWDVVRIWHVLALSVVTGLAQAFGGPAYQSLLPSLVAKEHVPNAIAFNSIQFNLARVIGPLLAGAALDRKSVV